jgi:deoxycytidine triphosphate deaminase
VGGQRRRWTGHKYSVFKPKPVYRTSIHVDRSLWDSADLWEHHEQEKFTLDPGGFVLAQTLERVDIPPDLQDSSKGAAAPP